MANKKFYYKNKAKSSKDSAKKVADVALEKYSADQLGIDIQSLALSDATRELLLKNGITRAADLARRTEKDMYKVQGLNKRALFEVKDALKAVGMTLCPDQEQKRPEATPKQAAAKQRSADPKQKSPEPKKIETKAPEQSRFGLADRREQERPNAKRQKAQPEKLTAPLPVEQWRKIMKGGKWGFSDGFKVVIPAMYDEVFCFKEGLASVEIDEKCGFIDSNNEVIIPFDYDTAMSFSEGYAMVVKGDKCGYINKNNELVIPFDFDAATPFEDGEAKVKQNGKWATITPDGKLVWI